MRSPVLTSSAHCKDCHSCIRHCPVKAIRLRDGQAEVVDERCIACGVCVKSCSQNAKTVASDVPLVESMLAEKQKVVASLAPSFPAAFPTLSLAQVSSALYEVGFHFVEETAAAVPEVAGHYAWEARTRSGGTVISACCPVVVNLVEIYYPELIPLLSTSLSPMLVHANKLKKRFQGAKVVFIGPCVGKKQEADRVESSVDAVLTFAQLQSLLENRKVNLQRIGASNPGEPNDQPAFRSRRYPLHGGVLLAAGLDFDAQPDAIAVDGLENCIATLEDMKSGYLKPRFVEALACTGGCIGGPGMPGKKSIATRQTKVMEFALQPASEESSFHTRAGVTGPGQNQRQYTDRRFNSDIPSEAEIRAILSQIGKHSLADETNCGGCGYKTCRDKAIAVYQGLAEVEMCIPYMRGKVESVAQVVVETTRNGIIVVDKDLVIQDFNPAANRMFNRHGKKAKGKKLDTFIDPSLFKQVWETRESIVDQRVSYEQYDIVTRQTIYPLADYQLVVGVITDITAEEKRRQADNQMYDKTLEKASQVIHNQMKVAQDIAGLLGETTADTKATLLELIRIIKERSRQE